MYKLKGTVDEVLLALIDGIAEAKEYNCGNSGLNWRDSMLQEFFERV